METALTTPRATARTERLTVDLAVLTGPVHGGATGMLYGLSDVGVPSAALIAGARPHTVAQKAPDGLQHPNGDAVATASSFYDNGGEHVLVYMQDVYSQWPYEEPGIEDFLAKVTVMVTEVRRRPDVAKFQWVPFNEPDWIWYGDWDKDRDRFLADWALVYREIRRILPRAVIVGPNEMHYNPVRVKDFLVHALANDLMPDVMSWHELTPPSLEQYPLNYAAYRELEASLGIAPLPININEYGSRRDLSVPGRVVQWISMFEATKVDADMAYWTYAGNLDDHAVQTGQANGGWWLLKWYADLTGQTAQVTVLDPEVIGLRGLAAVDADRCQVTVLLGGAAGDVTLDLLNLPGAGFGNSVDVTVSSTSWSGYEGDAVQPAVERRLRVAVVDGSASIALPGGDVTAAYQVVVTVPEAYTAPVGTPTTTRYEAQHAALTEVSVVAETDDADEYFLSGGGYVDVMTAPTSAVAFTIEVPALGRYNLGILYGTAGVPAHQALYVDDLYLRTVSYPATLNPTYRGRVDQLVDLTAGRHVVSLRTAGPAGVLVDSAVSLDRLDVTGPVSLQRTSAPVRTARLSGGATLRVGTETRAAAVALASGVATFFVAAGGDGYYDLRTELQTADAGQLTVSVEDRVVQVAAVEGAGSYAATARVHLGRGVVKVCLQAKGSGIEVFGLTLTRAPYADSATVRLAVTEAQLAGGAALVDDLYAAEAVYVDGLGNASGTLTVARTGGAGAYNLTVGYGNAAKNPASHYNTDVISRQATISEAGGASVTAWFRHSYAWNNFWTLVLPLDLRTSNGALTVGNPTGAAPTVDRLALSPLVLSATVARTETSRP